MTTRAWFEIDDPDDDFEFDDTERAFVSALSGHCMAWAPADVVGEVGRPDDWESLLAHVSLSDRAEPRRHLIDLGVHLVGDRARGDRLHNQL